MSTFYVPGVYAIPPSAECPEGVLQPFNRELSRILQPGEREMLHAIIADCNGYIDPDEHPELHERISAVLLPCDEAGQCVAASESQREGVTPKGALVPLSGAAPHLQSLRRYRVNKLDDMLERVPEGQESDSDFVVLSDVKAALDSAKYDNRA